MANQALNDTLDWLESEGEVAIFDATNTTKERRQMVYHTVVTKRGFKCLFLGILLLEIFIQIAPIVFEYDYIQN